jgi:predicted RNA-binding Zn-ribbon protein involved in translation (DUF1610 family)
MKVGNGDSRPANPRRIEFPPLTDSSEHGNVASTAKGRDGARPPARKIMNNYLDDNMPIEAPCPKCGQNVKTPIGRIRSAAERATCPSCQVTIDNTDLAAALERVNQDIDTLMDALIRDIHIQRMIFNAKRNSIETEARPHVIGGEVV